jgi:hypothetical protein
MFSYPTKVLVILRVYIIFCEILPKIGILPYIYINFAILIKINIMKRLLLYLCCIVISMHYLSAQSHVASAKNMAKIAKKEAKNFKKNGWDIAVGDAPIEKQLEKYFQYATALTDDGDDKYMISMAINSSNSYNSALTQAMQSCRANTSMRIESEKKALQMSNGTHSTLRVPDLDRPIVLVKVHRIKNGLTEIMLQCAYPFE